MKRTTFRMIALAIKATYLRVRCSTVVEYGMPGDYVFEIKEGDYVVKHTLTIVCLSSIGNVYELTHKIDQWREVGNVQEIVHVKSEKWYGYYYPDLRQLVDADILRTVAFMPEHRKVILEKHTPTNVRKNHFLNTLTQVQ